MRYSKDWETYQVVVYISQLNVVIRFKNMELILIRTIVVLLCGALLCWWLLKTHELKRAQQTGFDARCNKIYAMAQIIRDPYELKECVYKEDLMKACEEIGISTRNSDGVEYTEANIAAKLIDKLPNTGTTR